MKWGSLFTARPPHPSPLPRRRGRGGRGDHGSLRLPDECFEEPSRDRFLGRARITANEQLLVDAVSFEHGRRELRFPLHGLREFRLFFRVEDWRLPVLHEQVTMLDKPVAEFGPARFRLALRFGGRTEQTVQRHGCHRATDRFAIRLDSCFQRQVGFDELVQPTPRNWWQRRRGVLLDDHRDAALAIVGGRELHMQPMPAITFKRVSDPMPLVRLVVFELTQQRPMQRADDDQVRVDRRIGPHRTAHERPHGPLRQRELGRADHAAVTLPTTQRPVIGFHARCEFDVLPKEVAFPTADDGDRELPLIGRPAQLEPAGWNGLRSERDTVLQQAVFGHVHEVHHESFDRIDTSPTRKRGLTVCVHR